MSVRGEVLYLKMKAKRDELVAKYTAGGTIRFDEAIGLIPVGGNPAITTAGATVGALVANNGRREKRIPDVREGDVYTSPAFGTRVTLDLDAIKAANLELDGAVTGSMMEALKLRAEGKTILLFANDAALRWGPVLLGEVSCMLKLMDNQTGRIRNAIFPAFGPTTQTGIIHSLPAFGGRPALVENEGLSHRGLAKRNNYRGDHEYLNNPISLWAEKDASQQSIMQLGVNSEIRMWGQDQVIDLNGKTIGAHERPNRVAAFSSIIDLSNGHFAGLTNKSAKGAHIFSSTTPGRLARNNHFAIRGHFVKGLLVENVISGKAGTLNQGSYFGTCILNDSSEIVFKNVKQEMLNKAVANSSMALSHYAQLFSIELGQGYYQRPSVWNQISSAYPWMKWEDLPAGATDTLGLGKQTAFPVVKSVEELVAAGIPTEAEATRVRSALLAMQKAHNKSMKSADDTYIQVNTGHGIIGKTFPMVSDEMTTTNQIPRSVNLIAQNPFSDETGVRYPDSVAYGFRVGKSAEGVGKLAEATITEVTSTSPFHTEPEKSISYGATVKDIYILDCEFSGMHTSPMETIAFATPQQGKMNTFNGNGLRPYGYTNANTAAASIAPASMLVSKEALVEAMIPSGSVDVGPYEEIDTAAKAVANTSATGWTAKKAHGLYKGNDVVEAGLAGAEALKLLKKYFSTGFAAQVLSGVDNSSLDLGVLAWRRSMMLALGAQTANHVGLKGGFKGDIIQGHLADGTLVDTYQHGEIYPWFVSEDGSVSIDKDVILTQPAVAASATKDRTLSEPYLGAELPAPSASLYRFKQLSAEQVQLVKCDEFDTPVTYQDCIDLLGFGSAPTGKTGSDPVIYDLLRNLDGQHHVHKGNFSVRLDSTEGFAVERLTAQDFDLTDVKPEAKGLGSAAKQIAYGVNDDAETESGVTKARGVVISASTEGRLEEIYVKDLASATYANGVEIRGGSSAIIVDKVICEDLSGGKKAVGVKVAFDCQDIALKSIEGKDITGEYPSQGLVVEIEAEDTVLVK